MESMKQSYNHAITPLAFDRTKLHREQLVDSITRSLPKKLIAIIAPAGYGKSTLLADFCAHSEVPNCWVRLSDADQDVIRFAGVLETSLCKRFRRLKNRISSSSAAASTPEGLGRAFAMAIGEHIQERFILLLDDVHFLNPSASSLAFLDTLISLLPENLTLIVAGRELPEISLAKLVINAEMIGIGQHDLALSANELSELVTQRLGRTLALPEIEKLLDMTQGWVTGVLLSSPPSGDGILGLEHDSEALIYDYLAGAFLDQEDDGVLQFMQSTAVLPNMTAESCNYLLGIEDSQRMLSILMRKGMFIAASDSSPQIFEYHRLMTDFLLDKLRTQDPDRLYSLQIRAADYLAQINPEEAVHLYLKAGSTDRALSLMDGHAQTMFEAGRIETLQIWSRRLFNHGQTSPRVELYLVGGCLDRGHLDEAEQHLQRAFNTLETIDATDQLKDQGGLQDLRPLQNLRLTWVRARNFQARLALQRGNFNEVFQAVEQAELLLSQQPAPLEKATCMRLRARALSAATDDLLEAQNLASAAVELLEAGKDPYTLSQALFDLSLILKEQGKFNEAHVTNARAHEILVQLNAPLPLAISYNNLGVSAHMQGMYEQAMDQFAEGLKQAEWAASASLQALIQYGQADLFSDLGLSYQAAELYGKGLLLATELANSDLMRYGYLRTSILHRRCKTNQLPLIWLQRAIDLDDEKQHPADALLQMAALSLASSPAKGEKILKKLLEQHSGRLPVQERCLVHFFLGRAALHKGDHKTAGKQIELALEQAGATGSEQVLAGELFFEDELLDFSRQEFSANAILQIIHHRIELMKAMARKYKRGSTITPQGAKLALRALGGSEIIFQDEVAHDLEPLPRQVLFYLADGGRVHREGLLEAFWPDGTIDRQTSSLYTSLHALRRKLSRKIICIDDRYIVSIPTTTPILM
jgi:tetratricopeptide (TPR) repeat protein